MTAGTGQKGKDLKCLVVAYTFNVEGIPSAHHLMDRLPEAARHGVKFRVVSGLISRRMPGVGLIKVPPIFPGEIRFLLRWWSGRRFAPASLGRALWKLFFLPLLPLFLLERLLPFRDFTTSWSLPGSIAAILTGLLNRPDVIYSFGGRNCSHVAGYAASRVLGVPWVAQLQDPLVHGHAWRNRREECFVRWLERRIMTRAHRVIFMTRTAMENAEERTGRPGSGVVNYPGFDGGWFEGHDHNPGPTMEILHVGGLDGTRDPGTFLAALEKAVEAEPSMTEYVTFRLVGHLGTRARDLLAAFPRQEMLTTHEPVSRAEAYGLMERADLLLLITNRGDRFSTETVPSKFYEYLYSGRPVLAVVWQNSELSGLLEKYGHTAISMEDEAALTSSVIDHFRRWQDGSLAGPAGLDLPSVGESADRLVKILAAAAGTGSRGDDDSG
jgi:hypothetical protein